MSAFKGCLRHTLDAVESNLRPGFSDMTPPHNLPIYRLLTGPDDASFCRRVSDALALGYLLHGSPAATFNGVTVIVAQALIWPNSLRSDPSDAHIQPR